jgi:DNA-binding winged helix-turn-helix (wHTH) protein
MQNGATARAYRVNGQFVVDAARQSVRTPAAEIHLRRKTFKVLQVLIENRDRTVSKDELIAAVWQDTAVTDDVLVTSITEIRRAFEDDPRASRFIKTIHGTGYRWIATVAELARDAPEDSEEGSGDEPRDDRPKRAWMRIAGIAAGFAAIFLVGALRARNAPPVAHAAEVAWWKFDEATGDITADSSGFGNSGRIASGVRRIPGRIGGALEFDGVSDGVSGKAHRSLAFGSSPRTITAWIRTDSTSADFTSIFHYGLDGSRPPAANFTLALTPDGRIQAGNGFNYGFATGRLRVDDGAWHLVTAVYEAAESRMERIYIDGVEDASAALNMAPATIDAGVWRIGRFLGTGTHFRGALDDVRVYDRALGAAEIQALFRCSSGAKDLGEFYYLPVMGGMARVEGGEIVNAGRDIGGVQLAKSDGACGVASLDGVSVGQDLYLAADLMAPSDPDGARTEAGLYFRSRKAHAGDGIMGGTSAGYYVRIRAGGQVSVMCLNPGRVIAWAEIADFAPDRFHRMEIAAVGDTLEARVDGRLMEWVQGGSRGTRVSIPPSWDGPPKIGDDDGTAGVVFTADLNRGRLGGQRARNITIRQAAELFSKP